MAVTHSQFATMLQNEADFWKEVLINFGREGSENIIALVNAIKADAIGNYSGLIESRADARRAAYAAFAGPSAIRRGLDPVFQSALLDLIDNKGATDPQAAWDLIYRYFDDNGYAVLSRGIDYDTSATAAGTGNGSIYRLTTNVYGREIEGVDAPVNIEVACTVDEVRGAEPGEETFSIAVKDGAFDILERGNTVGFAAPVTMQSLNSDGDYLTDASFQLSDAAVADPDDLGAWIDSAGTYGSAKYALLADAEMSSAEEVETGTALSLEIKGNHTISQDLDGLAPNVPHFWTMRVKPGASISAGTLTVTWGSKSQAFDLTGLSAGNWNTIAPDLDEDLYPYNFAGADPKFQLAVTSLSGDTVQVDLVRFGPMTQFNGTWWWHDAGSTQALAGTNQRTFNFSDGLDGSDSIIQQIIRFGYGLGYDLPARANATQVTASGGRTLTFATASDTITASSGDFASDGYFVGMTLTVAGTSNNNGSYTITNVTATVITVSENLTDEGPLSSTATLDATPSITDP